MQEAAVKEAAGWRDPMNRTRSASRWTATLLISLSIACSGKGCGSAKPPQAADSKTDAPAVKGQPPAVPLVSLSPEQKRQIYDARIAGLREQVARAQEFVDRFPKELVDVDALASTLKTPEAAFAFVRDRIAFEPYPGVMKGAAGTLVSRGGNAIDRSLLLVSLLARNGVGAKIAHGPMPKPQAVALLQQIRSTPDAVEQIARSLPQPVPPSKVDERQRQGAESLQSEAQARGRARRDEAEAGVAVLAASLQKAGVAIGRDREDAQLALLQDHYWVQAPIGGDTVDLDPSIGTATMNQRFAEPVETFAADHLPDALYQRVGIRVVADVLEAGRLSSKEIVRADATTIDLFNRNIRVIVAPQKLALGQNDYQAEVTMGDAAIVAGAFQIRAASPPEKNRQAGDAVDALSGEVVPAEQPSAGGDRAVLGRLAIEVVTNAPVLGEARYRRVVMDRIESERQPVGLQVGMADDNSIRTLLLQVWDGAIAVGASHPLQMFLHQVQALKSQQAVTERALANVYLGQPLSSEQEPQARLPLQLVEFFFYSSLAHHLIATENPPRVRQYQLRPRLAFYRHGVVVHDWSKPGESRRIQDSIDLINLPYGFVGKPDETGPVALKVGVADTTLERAFAGGMDNLNTVPLLEAARGQKIPLIAASPAQTQAIDQLSVPTAIRRVLRDELARGRTLVLPTTLVAVDRLRTLGWWSIDPESGVPLGEMDLGAGQAMVENRTLTTKIMTLSHTFSKFYGGLLGCFFIEAADQLVPPDGPYEVTPTFSFSKHHYVPGLPSIVGGKGLGDCIAERVCEAVVEYAFLAAETASWAERSHILDIINELLGLIGPTAVSVWMHGCTE
jgi:hypothetical protein